VLNPARSRSVTMMCRTEANMTPLDAVRDMKSESIRVAVTHRSDESKSADVSNHMLWSYAQLTREQPELVPSASTL